MIYHLKTYRDVIRYQLDHNQHVKGYRTKLAKAAGFHPSTLPQVLAETIHLTPEQGIGLCQFWQFDERSTDYFITLLNYERASTKQLKKYLKGKLEKISRLSDLSSLKVRDHEMSSEEATEYFTSWEYSAVHCALTLEGVHSASIIADMLTLHPSRVEKILRSLETMKLAEKKGKKWSSLLNSSLINQNRDLFSRLYMSSLQSKALSMTTKHHDAFYAGIVFPTDPEDLAAIRVELGKICRRIAGYSAGTGQNSLGGICLNLFELGRVEV